MARGLIWLPLLGLIVGLFWLGWREYQKVEGYRIWSEKYDRAKYDIYAVIGITEDKLTWGKPTPQGIANLETLNLKDVKEIQLQIGDRIYQADNLPAKKIKETPQLVFHFLTDRKSVAIPFTEAELAAKWQQYLAQKIVKTSLS